MLTSESKEFLIANYREHLKANGCAAAATQMSAEGQAFRFQKLAEIDDLNHREVLDLGCGIADFYPVLKARHPEIRYTGIDLVPEMAEFAQQRFPEARFLSRDVLAEGLDQEYDYVLLSAIFNNAIPDCTGFLKQLVEAAFSKCRLGVGFNFISNRVNFTDPEMAYHDPAEVLTFCMDRLSRRITMDHHYGKCDVAVFVRK